METESDRAVRLTVLFETCEALLLYCGPLLVSSVREAFTAVVHQALTTLSQGILTPQMADRHMHRNAGAKIRQDPLAQRLLLQLATVEVFSPPQLQHQTQQFSRNLPLLKRCAELCLRNSVTAAVAARALLHFSTLLHPVTVALPAVSAVDTARSYILSASDALPSHTSSGAVMMVQPSTERTELLSNEEELTYTSPVATREETQTTVPSSVKSARATASAEETPNKRAKIVAEVPFSAAKSPAVMPNTDLLSRRSSLQDSQAASANLRAAQGDDEDESLPDIDIDADPDSD